MPTDGDVRQYTAAISERLHAVVPQADDAAASRLHPAHSTLSLNASLDGAGGGSAELEAAEGGVAVGAAAVAAAMQDPNQIDLDDD